MSDVFNRPYITLTRAHVLVAVPRRGQHPVASSRIWTLLTDARNFHRWNSTVSAIEGEIRDGQRIRIHVPGTDRTFTPRVSNVVPDVRMAWTGGFAPLFKGVRTFALIPQPGGSTTFVMQERFSSFMLPIVGRSMPDFELVFERYAIDLKREAERAHAQR